MADSMVGKTDETSFDAPPSGVADPGGGGLAQAIVLAKPRIRVTMRRDGERNMGAPFGGAQTEHRAA
jgi:hypothetical protein